MFAGAVFRLTGASQDLSQSSGTPFEEGEDSCLPYKGRESGLGQQEGRWTEGNGEWEGFANKGRDEEPMGGHAETFIWHAQALGLLNGERAMCQSTESGLRPMLGYYSRPVDTKQSAEAENQPSYPSARPTF